MFFSQNYRKLFNTFTIYNTNTKCVPINKNYNLDIIKSWRKANWNRKIILRLQVITSLKCSEIDLK